MAEVVHYCTGCNAQIANDNWKPVKDGTLIFCDGWCLWRYRKTLDGNGEPVVKKKKRDKGGQAMMFHPSSGRRARGGREESSSESH
jgi:hypothetical protein